MLWTVIEPVSSVLRMFVDIYGKPLFPYLSSGNEFSVYINTHQWVNLCKCWCHYFSLLFPFIVIIKLQIIVSVIIVSPNLHLNHVVVLRLLHSLRLLLEFRGLKGGFLYPFPFCCCLKCFLVGCESSHWQHLDWANW